MRLRGKAAIAVGAAALTAALGGAAGLSVPVTAAATVTTGAQAAVTIHPDIAHVGHGSSQPPTTADCEAAFQVACYEPGQVQQAYNLPMLYDTGVTGKGATIVTVDSFGSPTIQHDLATFDATFGLPAPPSFQVLQPAGA